MILTSVDFGRCPDVLFVHSLFAQTSFERARWTSLIQRLDIHIDPRLLSLRCPICNFCLSCSCSEQILLRALQSLLSLAPKFATKILPTLLSEKAQFCTAALYNSLLDTRISWLSILFVYLCIPWGFQTSNWHIICHLILLRAQAEKLEMVSLYFLAWQKYRWSNDHPKLYWRAQLRTCSSRTRISCSHLQSISWWRGSTISADPGLGGSLLFQALTVALSQQLQVLRSWMNLFDVQIMISFLV